MQMQPQGAQQNIQTGPVKYNHGGHEVNDMHEILTCMIGLLEQYTIYRDFIQDQELKQILDHQYQFFTDEYNMLVQSFSTGQDPAHGTRRYQMNQSNETITYGLQPTTTPKTPKQSTQEINCAAVSGYMLGLVKTLAAQKTMAALEVTNPVVRRVLQDSIPNTIEMAYEISLWQNKKGHYQIPQYTEQDMETILNKFAPAPQGSSGSGTTLNPSH